jgi:TPR repeat protein
LVFLGLLGIAGLAGFRVHRVEKLPTDPCSLGIRLDDTGHTAEAEGVWQRAAEEGDQCSQFFLGRLYLWNHPERKHHLAEFWFKKAAAQENNNDLRARAESGLGEFYVQAGNVKEAVRWYRLAVEHADEYGAKRYLEDHGYTTTTTTTPASSPNRVLAAANTSGLEGDYVDIQNPGNTLSIKEGRWHMRVADVDIDYTSAFKKTADKTYEFSLAATNPAFKGLKTTMTVRQDGAFIVVKETGVANETKYKKK